MNSKSRNFFAVILFFLIFLVGQEEAIAKDNDGMFLDSINSISGTTVAAIGAVVGAVAATAVMVKVAISNRKHDNVVPTPVPPPTPPTPSSSLEFVSPVPTWSVMNVYTDQSNTYTIKNISNQDLRVHRYCIVDL